MRWVTRIGAGLGALLLLVAGTVYALSEQRIGKKYEILPWSGNVPSEPSAELLARGAHLAKTRGCLDCHREDGRGGLFADVMPVMRLVPANITPAGVTKNYSAADWERAIRHCVRPDGSPIPFMPCIDNARLADDDLVPLVAFLRSLKPVPTDPDTTEIGPLGRFLFVAGQFPYVNAELIDHSQRAAAKAPPMAATPEYGAYLIDMCVGCHGQGLSGGPIPGVPPEWPEAGNLTPDATGLEGWSEADFVKVLRTGTRPDGRVIDPSFMPWKQFAIMSDVELSAMWLHLQRLPAKPKGGR